MSTTNRSLKPTLREELRVRLREARFALFRTAALTGDELASLEAREPGPPTEDAGREETIGILARLGDQERHEVEEIDAALARLRAGSYGACEGCRGTIPLPRLRAMPATRFCLTCQAIREGRRHERNR